MTSGTWNLWLKWCFWTFCISILKRPTSLCSRSIFCSFRSLDFLAASRFFALLQVRNNEPAQPSLTGASKWLKHRSGPLDATIPFLKTSFGNNRQNTCMSSPNFCKAKITRSSQEGIIMSLPCRKADAFLLPARTASTDVECQIMQGSSMSRDKWKNWTVV